MDKQVEIQLIIDDLKFQIEKNKEDQEYCRLQKEQAGDGVVQMLDEKLNELKLQEKQLKHFLERAENEISKSKQPI